MGQPAVEVRMYVVEVKPCTDDVQWTWLGGIQHMLRIPYSSNTPEE